MQVPDEYTPDELDLYASRMSQAATQEEAKLQQLQSYHEDCKNAVDLVKALPDKLQHDILVPFGPMAFFPGQLIHTNELMVHVGSGYHVECTAKHATEILSRREVFLSEQISRQEKQVESLNARKALPDTALTHDSGEELVDIRENLEESDMLLSQAKPASAVNEAKSADLDQEFDELMAKLSKLEKEEAETSAVGDKGQEEDGDVHDPEDEEDDEETDEEDEDEDDSDDDPEYTPAIMPEIPASVLQQSTPKPASTSSTVSSTTTTSTTPSTASKSSAFKKGFLLSSSKPNPQPKPTQALSQPPASTQPRTSTPAFSGQVLERPAPVPASTSPTAAPTRKASISTPAFTGEVRERTLPTAATTPSTTTSTSFTGGVREREATTAPRDPSATQSSGTAFTGEVRERTAAAPAAVVSAPSDPVSTAPARVSKFKQRLRQGA